MITNGNINDNLNTYFRLQSNELSSLNIKKDIQPTFDVRKPYVVECYTAESNSASGVSALTVQTGRTFMLTSAHCDMIKDATCDIPSATTGMIALTTDGKVITVVRYSLQTLTAQERDTQITFNPPIKCDSGTTIGIGATGAKTAGNILRSLQIQGYYL